MAEIPEGISQFLYNGPAIPLAQVTWRDHVVILWTVSPDRKGWVSYDVEDAYQNFSTLSPDGFYLIHAKVPIFIPDAQITACADGVSDVPLPVGLAQFVYSGPDVDLNASPWKSNIDLIFTANADRTGYIDFDPSQELNSLQTLKSNTFYVIQSNTSFTLPGAQQTGCPDSFGQEATTDVEAWLKARPGYGANKVLITDSQGAIVWGVASTTLPDEELGNYYTDSEGNIYTDALANQYSYE